MTVDFRKIGAGLDRVSASPEAGNAAALAARRAMDRYVRKDTGQLARTAKVRPWHVRYEKRYARRVWGPGTRIVSPRNPGAVYNPHKQKNVKAAVQRAIARKAKEVFGS